MLKRTSTIVMLLAAALLVGASPAASVQDAGSAKHPAKQKPAADQNDDDTGEQPPAPADFLAGPEVEEEADDGDDGMMMRRQYRREIVRPLEWRRILLSLDLSAEQLAKIESIYREYELAEQAFRDEHGEELRSIRRAQRAARQAGAPPTPDPEQRRRMAEIQDARPRIELYQERIWAELTVEQQDTMRIQLEAVRERMRERRERAENRRADAEGDGGMMNDSERGPFADLDEMGRMRLRFLLSRQLRDDEPPPRAPRPGDVVRDRRPDRHRTDRPADREPERPSTPPRP